MHGLAFAALLGELDLGRGSLVTELLGFNLGIELTQLIVVALIMPSLMVLSRTRVYPAVRIALAGFGVVLAGSLVGRTDDPDRHQPAGAPGRRTRHTLLCRRRRSRRRRCPQLVSPALAPPRQCPRSSPAFFALRQDQPVYALSGWGLMVILRARPAAAAAKAALVSLRS